MVLCLENRYRLVAIITNRTNSETEIARVVRHDHTMTETPIFGFRKLNVGISSKPRIIANMNGNEL